MMKITNIVGKEIFDCRGIPTVECEIHLDDGFFVNASVPSGISTSKYEAVELRDNEERLLGTGVNNAINNINEIISPEFIGEKIDAVQMDLQMIEMDGTPDKSKLGGNATLAVSMALYKAHAYAAQVELFNFIALVSDATTVTLPVPMINFVNGGAHANNNLLIQEYLVIPFGASDIRSAIENSVVLFYELKELLKQKEKSVCIGTEGGFAGNFEDDVEPFEFILKAVKRLQLDEYFTLGIDVAASQFYDTETGLYKIRNIKKTSDEMIQDYRNLTKKYNLFSIEDGLAQDDWAGWIKINAALGDKMHIIADDLFATNPERILKGVEYLAANAAVIKPNQIGTITETLQAIQICKENGLSTVVSHRAGETNDSFIIDLAVGASSNYIKCGGLNRGERIEKYNRLLEIENILTSS